MGHIFRFIFVMGLTFFLFYLFGWYEEGNPLYKQERCETVYTFVDTLAHQPTEDATIIQMQYHDGTIRDAYIYERCE